MLTHVADKALDFVVNVNFIVNLEDHVFVIQQEWVHDLVPFFKIKDKMLVCGA